jgi:uncharacterized lipoprotein YehR (DUF1307 family)
MKKLLMLLVAGTMVFAVSGCGQKSTADKAKDTSTSAKKDAGKAVDSAKKDATKALDDLKK